MADRGALEAAAAAGVINPEQVGPLHDFLSSRDAGVQAAAGGEEELRFIRNFHDVFLAIGIFLFAVGLAIGIGTITASSAADAQSGTILAGSLCAGAAVVMWLLGEVFARRRRLFLPAIAIVCALTLFAVVAGALLYAGLVLGRGFESEPNWQSIPPELRIGILTAVGLGVIAPLAFYARFRLPFSLGLVGGGFAAFVLVAALMWNAEQTLQMLPALYLGLGLLLFAAAVGFDARDPARNTRFSDNGFWLHFAAAPLLLNGAFGLIGQAFGGDTLEAMSPSGGLMMAGANGDAVLQASATLLVVVALGLVSLLINRRVLIVSALLTTGVAIGILMNSVGLGAGALAASTLTVLGAFVLILGAGWHAVRRALLSWVKPDGAWARIFPPEAPAAA